MEADPVVGVSGDDARRLGLAYARWRDSGHDERLAPTLDPTVAQSDLAARYDRWVASGRVGQRP